MAEIRRDKKGRKLKDGESQRKDGRYQFRYTDISGERRYLYDWDLDSLRAKEKDISFQLSQGVSYFGGSVPLSDLTDKLFQLKPKWKESTRSTMNRYLAIVQRSNLYSMPVNKIKTLDCKTFLVGLHEQGMAFGTIRAVYTILRESLDLACESDLILKNPCNFKLVSLIPNDTPKVVSLTEEQERSLFHFLETDVFGRRYLDMFTVLIGTGLRISEYAGLTIKDIDFVNNVVHVDKQLLRLNGSLKITRPKSKSGYRDIPMTAEVRQSFTNLIERRKDIKTDVMVDGYVGFISVTRNGRPRNHSEYADAFRALIARYNERSDVQIEHCTPHTLRHMFCTKCVAAKMDVKTVQYLMGHSDASTTLNVYTDAVKENVASSMQSLKLHQYGT